MTPGDKVELQGYDLMAVVNYVASDSKLLVMHNNSTHILLFRIDDPSFDLDLSALMCINKGVYVAAWRYFPYLVDESRDFAIAYKLAMTAAVGMAVGDLSDGS